MSAALRHRPPHPRDGIPSPRHRHGHGGVDLPPGHRPIHFGSHAAAAAVTHALEVAGTATVTPARSSSAAIASPAAVVNTGAALVFGTPSGYELSGHPGELLPGQPDYRQNPGALARAIAYATKRGIRKPPDMSKLPPGGIVGVPPAGADPSNYYEWDGVQWRGGSARDSRGSSNAHEWIQGGTPTHPDAPWHISGET